jgi:hypothetical protein
VQTPDADPATTPVDADGVSAVAVGTALWAIAGVILIVFFRAPLADANASWWLWVPLVGAVLGLLGLSYVIRRRSAYRAAANTTADKGHSRS